MKSKELYFPWDKYIRESFKHCFEDLLFNDRNRNREQLLQAQIVCDINENCVYYTKIENESLLKPKGGDEVVESITFDA